MAGYKCARSWIMFDIQILLDYKKKKLVHNLLFDYKILVHNLNPKLIFMGCKQRKSSLVAVLRYPKYFRIFFHNY